jgi:DnaJ-class molecular chaperone
MDNYYKILGVKNFASLDEIKVAYKKLAKKFHPDVNDGDKFFEDKFKELHIAYEILSDSKRRVIYDENLKGFFQMLIQIQRLRLKAKQNTAPSQSVKRASPYVFEKGRYVKRRRF